jgi:hypothetical protein
VQGVNTRDELTQLFDVGLHALIGFLLVGGHGFGVAL